MDLLFVLMGKLFVVGCEFLCRMFVLGFSRGSGILFCIGLECRLECGWLGSKVVNSYDLVF